MFVRMNKYQWDIPQITESQIGYAQHFPLPEVLYENDMPYYNTNVYVMHTLTHLD